MNYKPLPVGYENFSKIINEGYYYVDKTLFVKELMDKKAMVNLYTRPRRFGKNSHHCPCCGISLRMPATGRAGRWITFGFLRDSGSWRPERGIPP